MVLITADKTLFAAANSLVCEFFPPLSCCFFSPSDFYSLLIADTFVTRAKDEGIQFANPIIICKLMTVGMYKNDIKTSETEVGLMNRFAE